MPELIVSRSFPSSLQRRAATFYGDRGDRLGKDRPAREIIAAHFVRDRSSRGRLSCKKGLNLVTRTSNCAVNHKSNSASSSIAAFLPGCSSLPIILLRKARRNPRFSKSER